MAEVKKGITESALLTPQEHMIVGSTIGYKERPYTPLAVIKQQLSSEECDKLRKEHFRGRLHGGIVGYYGARGNFGDFSIEPLDTNPNSRNYGQTIKDPVLLSTDGENFQEDYRKDFPYRRAEPEVRLIEVKRKPEVKRLGGLEGKLPAVISISGLVLSLFFLSGITGNAIGNSTVNTSLGAVLLIIGLVAGFFWLKSRKKIMN